MMDTQPTGVADVCTAQLVTRPFGAEHLERPYLGVSYHATDGTFWVCTVCTEVR